MRSLALTMSAVASLALAACGDSGPSCLLDTDCPLYMFCDTAEGECLALGGRDAGMDGSVGRMDAGPPDTEDAGPRPDGGGPDAGRVVQVGEVTASSAVTAGSYSVTAFFARSDGSSPCTTTEMGACTVTACPGAGMPDAGMPDAGPGPDAGMPDAGMPGIDAGPGDAGTPMTAPNTGSIFVNNGAEPVTLLPAADGTYPAAIGTVALWTSEVALLFVSTGADVPAFNAMVTTPNQVTVSSPAFPVAPAALGVSVAAGMAFAWSGESTGQVVVTLVTSPPLPGGPTTSVTCSYDAAVLTGSLPPAALSTIAPGTTGSMSMGVVSEVVPAGVAPWEITVRAHTFALRPDGTEARVAVSFM